MIKERFISGIKWTSLTSICSVLIQVAQMAILARLLDPTLFGIIAIALLVIDFCYMFLDLGVANIIIFKEHTTANQLSTLFWLNVICGGLLFIIVFFSAPLIAVFFGDANLVSVIRWVGVSFLIRPLEIQFLALLRKKLQFQAIAKRQMAAMFLSFIAAVTAAYLDFGVYSLVILFLSNVVFSSILIFKLGLTVHRPSFHFNYKELRSFWSLGFYLTADSFLLFFNRQIDTILIGRLFPIGVLGGYNVAKNFAYKPYSLINPIVNQVSFPIMSGMQDQPGLIRSIYLKSLNYLSSINFPIYTYLVVYSSQIVEFIFGPKWLFIVPVLQILCITFAIRSIFNPMGSLIMSKGVPKVSFLWNLTQFILLPVILYFSAGFGIEVVALSQLAILLFLFWPGWKFVILPLTGIGFKEYAASLFKPAVTSLILGVMLAMSLWAPVSNAVLQLLIGFLIMLVFYLPLCKRFNVQVFNEIDNQLKNSKQLQVVASLSVVKFMMKL